MPIFVSDRKQTPIFEYCMVKDESKNRFQKTRAHTLLTFQNVIIN